MLKVDGWENSGRRQRPAKSGDRKGHSSLWVEGNRASEKRSRGITAAGRPLREKDDWQGEEGVEKRRLVEVKNRRLQDPRSGFSQRMARRWLQATTGRH